MGKRIYVGNLSWSVDKAKIEELFSGFGEIEDALVIADKYTSRSRGFGFVTFKNDADADKAIVEMNDKEVEGRSLKVREAEPRREAESAEKKPEEKPKEEAIDGKKSEEKPKEEI